MRPKAFQVINDAAVLARGNDCAAVRALTEAVFTRFWGEVAINHSLISRLWRAEMDVREGRRAPVSEAKLSEAANDSFRASGAPVWASTSVEQLHLLRTQLKPQLPGLVGSLSDSAEIVDLMSPAEAVFIILFLVKGMMDEPACRVHPDEWIQRALKRRARPSSALLSVRVVSPLRLALERNLAEEGSATSNGIHSFLDRLGF